MSASAESTHGKRFFGCESLQLVTFDAGSHLVFIDAGHVHNVGPCRLFEFPLLFG
jgi:hypothetical protein